MTMRAFGVLDPRIDGLSDFEVLLTLLTTIFVEWHREGSFLLVAKRLETPSPLYVAQTLTSLSGLGDLDRPTRIHLL
jgi:hypothetical protein